jgi:hypothetical protein
MKKALNGLTVIVIGGILLANTTGYLPWGVWWGILSLWPLLIVAVGIEIIGRSLGAAWLEAVSSLVVIAGLLFGALVLPSAERGVLTSFDFAVFGTGEEYSFRAPHDGRVEEGVAHISGGVGEITIAAGDDLAAAEGISAYGDPEFEVKTEGDHADVNIASSGRKAGISIGSRSETNVTLDRDVVWDIDIETGVSSLEADLSDLVVERLAAGVGISGAELTFGERADHATAFIASGVASVHLRVPEGVGVELYTKTGLTGLEIDDTWEKLPMRGDMRRHRTLDYILADKTLEITVNAGISSVRVERY